MKYYSTNRRTPEVSLREAVVASMAPDNGLYMPERIERLPDAFFDGIARLDLHRIACRVADAFFGEEIEPETLRRIDRIDRDADVEETQGEEEPHEENEATH